MHTYLNMALSPYYIPLHNKQTSFIPRPTKFFFLAFAFSINKQKWKSGEKTGELILMWTPLHLHPPRVN